MFRFIAEALEEAPWADPINPRVDGTCVYGPSLAPVDRPGEKITGVAAGATTCLHELAMLMSLTVQPCMRWQELGFGRASLLYRRTQIMLEAARLLPAHRRLPHATFLNGLWWKLLALQPERIVACLPNLQPRSRSFSATELYCPGSCTHADSLPSLEPWRCQKECLPCCKLWHFRADAEYIIFMQKRTYYVIGNPINSSDMLSRTGSTTQWLVDQTNGWGLPNTNTSIGYGVNSRWDAMT